MKGRRHWRSGQCAQLNMIWKWPCILRMCFTPLRRTSTLSSHLFKEVTPDAVKREDQTVWACTQTLSPAGIKRSATGTSEDVVDAAFGKPFDHVYFPLSTARSSLLPLDKLRSERRPKTEGQTTVAVPAAVSPRKQHASVLIPLIPGRLGIKLGFTAHNPQWEQGSYIERGVDLSNRFPRH